MKALFFIFLQIYTWNIFVLASEIPACDYDSSHPKFEKINTLIQNADRRITCIDENQYTMDIGAKIGIARNLHKFTLEDLEGFLINEKHKEALVIILAKGVEPNNSDEKEKLINSIVSSFVPFGYKNMIITSSNSVGVIALLAHKVAIDQD